jgi:hypothetical protein
MTSAAPRRVRAVSTATSSAKRTCRAHELRGLAWSSIAPTAGYKAPLALEELGAEVIALGVDRTASTSTGTWAPLAEALARKVHEVRAASALRSDGDADASCWSKRRGRVNRRRQADGAGGRLLARPTGWPEMACGDDHVNLGLERYWPAGGCPWLARLSATAMWASICASMASTSRRAIRGHIILPTSRPPATADPPRCRCWR